MTALSNMSDVELMAAFHDAIEREPVEDQPVLRKIAMLLSAISRDIKSIRSHISEMNVTSARMINRMEQFAASGYREVPK